MKIQEQSEAAHDGHVRKGVVEEGVPSEAWKRVHPATPVLNGWRVVTVLVAFVLFQNLELLLSLRTLMTSGSIGLIFLAGVGAFALSLTGSCCLPICRGEQ